MKPVEEFDIVGVGFGPANIALAVSLEEMELGASVQFLESNTAPDWQPDMLLDGSDIQHNPLRDFVTPRNPCSPYGFLSYLKSEDRLFEFLNLGLEFPFRKDYARYVRWVARHFDKWVSYGERATSIIVDPLDNRRFLIETSLGRRLRARAVSFGPGRTPFVPDQFRFCTNGRVQHFSHYLSTLARWKSERPLRSVAVIGSSQSAVEIVLDLASSQPDLTIHNVHRSYSYQLKDTSPFTERIYFPDFVDAYYETPYKTQRALTRELWRSNYSAADHDVITQLYVKLYEQKLDGRQRITLHPALEVMEVQETEDFVTLTLRDRLNGKQVNLSVDGVFLATGFRNLGPGENEELNPPLLEDIANRLLRREDGTLHVERDYRVIGEDSMVGPLFLNGLCESTHGFGDAGSFSLLSLRSWTIAESIRAALADSSGNITRSTHAELEAAISI